MIRYESLQALSEDHERFLTHGGMVVPWTAEAPPMNSTTLLRVKTPTGAYFDFPSRIVRTMPGEGFMVAFEETSRSTRVALDEFVMSDAFRQRLGEQDPPAGEARRVSVLAEDAESAPERAPADAADDGVETAAPPAQEPFRTPAPGESYAVFVVKYPSVLDFMTVHDRFMRSQRIGIPAANDLATPGEAAHLRISLPGRNEFQMFALVTAVDPVGVELRVSPDDPVYRNAVAYPRTTAGQKRLAGEGDKDRGEVTVTRFHETRASGDDDKMPLRRRIQRMTMEDKINLAQSGGREERMALAQDGNRAIHPYILRNGRLSTEEVAFMSRLATLNPDVLSKIGENPAFTQNPQIVKNLVYNPKTPIRVAVRLLDRLCRTEIMNIAKRTSMHRAIVSAAQKKVRGGR